jgi:hypothetical protein
MRRAFWWGLLLSIASGFAPACAHTPSETFLTLFVSATNVAGHWNVARRDLEESVRQSNPQWQSLPAGQQELWVEGLALDIVSRLEITADDRRLGFRVTDLEPVRLSAGEYQRVKFASTNMHQVAVLDINARALFRVDTNTHGRLRVEHHGRTETVAFSTSHPGHVFTLAQPASRGAQIWTFVREGVGHIWQGPDHILFLIALLLPSVLRQHQGRWAEADAFGSAVLRIIKIVTAFTLAHSVTLSLAALEVVRLSPRIVEPLIALSIIAAALNNLRPWFMGREWLVALGFGLVHGFGLAGGLIEFGLSGRALLLALLGFNGGVELGQLGVVALFLPVAFASCGSRYYRLVALKLGSTAVAGVALVWMAERIFEFKLLPF